MSMTEKNNNAKNQLTIDEELSNEENRRQLKKISKALKQSRKQLASLKKVFTNLEMIMY